MSQVIKHFCDSDFTDGALRDACAVLKVEPRNIVVLCSANYIVDLQLFQEKYHCAYVTIPGEILKDSDHWAVLNTLNGDIVWSPGA